MVKKFVFRRIRGRLIKIDVSKIAARTNLSLKRQKAIRTVRKAKKQVNRFKKLRIKRQRTDNAFSKLITNIKKEMDLLEIKKVKNLKVFAENPESNPSYNILATRLRKLRTKRDKNLFSEESILLGSGAENYVFKVNNKAVKISKSKIAPRRTRSSIEADNLKGGKFSILLSKKKISPETFVISTSKKDIIVQDIVKGTPKKLESEKLGSFTRKIENELGGSNIIANDLHSQNVLKTRKGLKVIDTGTFDFVEDGGDKYNFTKEQRKRLNKFLIARKKRKNK